MPRAEIKKLKKELAKRTDGGMSESFMEMFGKMVEVYLEYGEWIDKILEQNGTYQGYATREEAIARFKDYLDLIDDIKENGVKVPLYKYHDEYGTEIDGYHRLIISEKLGKKYVPISYAEKI